MLDARDKVEWHDVFDIGLGAAREWGRWLAAWPTREPASDLRALARDVRAELLIVTAAAVLINFAGRVIAFEIARLVTLDLPGLTALLWIQALAAFRVSLTKLWWRTQRDDAIREREVAIWCGAIVVSAVLAHLDPGLTRFAALPTTTWWERFPVTPLFSIWLALFFLLQGTSAARARFRRMRDLEAIRLRNSVPPSPLGLGS